MTRKRCYNDLKKIVYVVIIYHMVNPRFTSAHLGPDRVLQPRVAYLHEKGVSVSLPCGLQNLMWSIKFLPDLLLSADTELSALFLFPTDPFMSTWLSAPGTMLANPYLLTAQVWQQHIGPYQVLQPLWLASMKKKCP